MLRVRKRLPDGLKLRGDINVMLLGFLSTAKLQFLNFISKASPIGIYASGKGSSAAGLAASVVKNQSSGELLSVPVTLDACKKLYRFATLTVGFLLVINIILRMVP